MSPLEYIAAIGALVKIITDLTNVGKQLYGQDAIPSWEECMAQYEATQVKIDAEKG